MNYTSGLFAKKVNVTLRTIRFYDKKDILRPSFRNDNGNRYYTDEDLVKLQQILLLKNLGFSLDEIKEITLGSGDGISYRNLYRYRRNWYRRESVNCSLYKMP